MMPGSAAAEAATSSPTAICPTIRSGTSKATVTDDMSATVAMARLGIDEVADRDVGQADHAVERGEDRPLGQVELGDLHVDLGLRAPPGVRRTAPRR